MKSKIEDKVHKSLVSNYEKYYRLAFSYVRNQADAMDIVQEGACKAILKCDSVQKQEYLDTWIYRIMIHESLDFIKKNKKEYVELDSITVSSSDSYEDTDLQSALDTLDPFDKTIVTLRFFEDLSLEQIASLLNENINTVKSRLYRSLKKLKISLAQ